METVEAILDEFVERLFRMMLDHHQTQVVEVDLTLVQAQALKLLRAAPLPPSKLAAALSISAPAVTQLTDRLARKNLIERRHVKSDRRAVIVALTEKGDKVIDGIRRRRNEVFAETLSLLGNDDRSEVIRALSKMVSALQGLEPQPAQSLRAHAKAVRSKQTEVRTPDEPPAASKEVGNVPVSVPTRRMRIEWD